MGLRQPDDSHKVVTINTVEPYTNQKGETEHYPMGDGNHDVTVSTGPSYRSQREAVAGFLDTLIQNLSFAKNASAGIALSCNSFITVMETTEVRNLHDPSGIRDLTSMRILLVQPQVSPRPVVITEIRSQSPL